MSENSDTPPFSNPIWASTDEPCSQVDAFDMMHVAGALPKRGQEEAQATARSFNRNPLASYHHWSSPYHSTAGVPATSDGAATKPVTCLQLTVDRPVQPLKNSESAIRGRLDSVASNVHGAPVSYEDSPFTPPRAKLAPKCLEGGSTTNGIVLAPSHQSPPTSSKYNRRCQTQSIRGGTQRGSIKTSTPRSSQPFPEASITEGTRRGGKGRGCSSGLSSCSPKSTRWKENKPNTFSPKSPQAPAGPSSDARAPTPGSTKPLQQALTREFSKWQQGQPEQQQQPPKRQPEADGVIWSGYKKDKLTPAWRAALETFVKPGGSAEQKHGKIRKAYIQARDDGPVHRSHYRPNDDRLCITVCFKSEKYPSGRPTHIFIDGSGTIGAKDEAF